MRSGPALVLAAAIGLTATARADGVEAGAALGSGAASAHGEPPAPPAPDGRNEDGERDLGSYEREALRRALAEQKLDVVAEPEGKVVRRIRVVNLAAFDDDVSLLAWLNNLRRTTREDVIAREVLLRPGDAWDPEIVEETRRNIQDPRHSSLVVIRAVRPVDNPGHRHDGTEDHEIDLLVVTRDVWSLRVSSTFEYQQDALSALSASLVETNFLGRRKLAALSFDMDLGSFSMGPVYVDPNVGGSRIELAARAAAVFSRDTGSPEGSRGAARVAYPLWSLDRRWGGSVSFRHEDTIARSFEGGAIRRYDAPETAEDDGLPWQYDRRELALQSEVVHSFPGAIVQRVGLGHELDLSRPSVLDDFPGDDVQRAAFERDVLPRSERASSLYARYRLFEPRYVIARDLDTFDLREERRIGPEFRLKLSLAAPALGSEATFLRGRSRVAWRAAIAGDGLASAAVEGDARWEAGELIDNEVRGELTLASPRIHGIGRMLARLDASARIRERSNRFYTLGGMSGLRGYPIGHYTGQRRVRINVEARTVGVPVWMFRGGAVAFWDAGHAADTLGQLSLRHDVGVGVRFLSPQFSRLVFRVDWAVPLQGPSPGFPGRITAGAGQVF